MRSTYTVPPYGLRITFTDNVKEFHALRASKVDFRGLSGGWDAGKRVDGVVGIFDGRITSLVHEAVHAASYILKTCGIDPQSNEAEPLAYLVDHLVAVGMRRLRLK